MYHGRSQHFLRETMHLPPHLRLTEDEAYRVCYVLTPEQRKTFYNAWFECIQQAKNNGQVGSPLV